MLMFARLRSQKKRVPSRRRYSFVKPMLEVLEDRRLLDADPVNVTTQITLVAPFGGANNVSALVNKTAGLGSGLSYTTSDGIVGHTVTATGATQISQFKVSTGGVGQFQSFALVETFALQGVVIPPVGGAAFSAQFTKGVIEINAVPFNSFNPQDTSTWGTITGIHEYTATVQTPPTATIQGQGPLGGDTGFAGQPIVGQNEAHFFPATGVSSVDALAMLTLSNPGTLFASPQPFSGFQVESTEVNSLTGPYDQVNFPTNAQLDANFNTLAALAPGQGLVLNQFAANNYAATAGPNGPNTLQLLGFTQYPFAISAPSITTSQQPASATVGSSIADKATVTGLVNPSSSDTVTFKLFNNPNGTGPALFTSTVTVTLGSGGTATATSTSFIVTAAGTDYWVATFNGDSNNHSVSSGTAAEPVTITPGTPVGPGTFATIGFWGNKNGQAVINSFNNGPNDTQLGNWLATNFPHLFGAANPYTGTSLAGLTNATIATIYDNLSTAGVQANTYIQAFAVALGIYADTIGLGFNATAAKFGFMPVPGGGGSLTFNVGNNGAAFGVPNGTSLTVMQILEVADANFDPATGLFYGGDPTLTSELNNVLAGITQAGDI
jgi:hypothetical protein